MIKKLKVLLKIKISSKALKTLTMFLCVSSFFSCATYDQIIKFDPNFHIASHLDGYIIDRHGNIVDFVSPKIDKFACLHETKVIELRDLLRNSRTKGLSIKQQLSKEDLSKLDRVLLLWENKMQSLINRLDNDPI